MEDINSTEPNIDLSSRKILIVEDTKSNYMLLQALLKPTKVNIIWAQNGSAAVDICKNTDDLDIVLMDIQLPDMSGCDITRIIKKFRKNLPVIAQTAFAMSGDRERCLEAGCDDYISKPITGYALISTITSHLKD